MNRMKFGEQNTVKVAGKPCGFIRNYQRRWLIRALMATLTCLLVLAIGIPSPAQIPSAAIITRFQGNGLNLRRGTERNVTSIRKGQRYLLDNPNDVLYVPGDNQSGATFAFIVGDVWEFGGLRVQTRRSNIASEYRFPCRGRGGFTISWRPQGANRDRACNPGISLATARNLRSSSPSSSYLDIAQAEKSQLKAQAADDEVVVVPDRGQTIINTSDTNAGIAVDVLVGNVLIKSAKHPEGRPVKAGERYSYPEDTITPIDRNAIINSPEMQEFLNPNNWTSPEIPQRVANGINEQLAEDRAALNLPSTVAVSPTAPSPTNRTATETQPQPSTAFQPQTQPQPSTAFQPTSTQSSAQSKQLKQGTSYGDPHIITFDGFRYSFQTVGEFTLVKSKDGNFEVQVRQSPVAGRQLSLNTAVAMKVGNSRVAFYSKNFPDGNTTTPLRIDGKPTVVQGNSLSLPGGGSITKEGETDYVVQWPTGEELKVHKIQVNNSEFMNVTPAVPEQSGRFVGLLGNLNGNPQDDLQTSSGKVLPSESTYGQVSQALSNVLPTPIPLSQIQTAFFEQLYKEFGNSWRISAANSLFDYAPGQSTDTFTDRSFPRSYMTLGSLLPAQIRQAEAVCRQAGVQGALLEGCIFDVGNTGEAGFARAAANALVDVVKNRVRDEIRQRIPIPGLPF